MKARILVAIMRAFFRISNWVHEHVLPLTVREMTKYRLRGYICKECLRVAGIDSMVCMTPWEAECYVNAPNWAENTVKDVCACLVRARASK